MQQPTPPNRRQIDWLGQILRAEFNLSDWELQQPRADASFRAYVRITHRKGSYMLMYFPPAKESGEIIVRSSKFLLRHNIRVPRLYAYDLALGTVLQEDMGNELLADANRAGAPDPALYDAALRQLELLQGLDASDFGVLDAEQLLAEMQLFSCWLLGKWLGADSDKDELPAVYEGLALGLAAAPNCGAHLDFHSRNLTVLTDDAGGKSIGVLDYQDLLQGHFCYDIWSLLKDAYICLSPDFAARLFAGFSASAQRRFGLSPQQVARQYNLIGVQRCLKVCGIFARLWLRDGKPRYLAHLPLVMTYMQGALEQLSQDEQDETGGFGKQQVEALLRLLPRVKQLTERKLASSPTAKLQQ